MNSFFRESKPSAKVKNNTAKNDTAAIYSTTHDVTANFNEYLQKHMFYHKPRHNKLLSAIDRCRRDLHFNFRYSPFDLKLNNLL